MPSPSFIPHQPSPLALGHSHFRNPQSASPSIPRHTAKIWDEYERRAIDDAKRRETTGGTNQISGPQSQSQRFSNGTVFDIIRSYDSSASPAASPRFEFDFATSTTHRKASRPRSSSTVAICKTCKGTIDYASDVCEKCIKSIVLPSSGESTPPLSPSRRNFATTNLPRLHKESTSGPSTPVSSSPQRRSQRNSATQLLEPPIRLASLRPPPSLEAHRSSTETTRSRKSSLTDPNEPFLRLQITRKPLPRTSNPTPATPPSASSQASNPRRRPSSLAPITTPPQYTHYSRHASATPSELSTLYPYISNSTTSPPSVCRASYSLQNTTSAWDDWDSDEEDKAGLVGYWRGKKWRGSRSSLAGPGARRDSAGKDDEAKEEGKRKRRGFVRAISCGCGEKE
jgi:hypothetical protein